MTNFGLVFQQSYGGLGGQGGLGHLGCKVGQGGLSCLGDMAGQSGKAAQGGKAGQIMISFWLVFPEKLWQLGWFGMFGQ